MSVNSIDAARMKSALLGIAEAAEALVELIDAGSYTLAHDLQRAEWRTIAGIARHALTPPGEPRLTPAGELAKSVIRECSACKGKHWCPNCEDRRDALASAVEAVIADVAGSPRNLSIGGES